MPHLVIEITHNFINKMTLMISNKKSRNNMISIFKSKYNFNHMKYAPKIIPIPDVII